MHIKDHNERNTANARELASSRCIIINVEYTLPLSLSTYFALIKILLNEKERERERFILVSLVLSLLTFLHILSFITNSPWRKLYDCLMLFFFFPLDLLHICFVHYLCSIFTRIYVWVLFSAFLIFKSSG